MAVAERCVINAMGGTTHNYSYCIRDPNIDITTGARQLSMQNVGKVFGELSNYMDYLIRKPDNVTRNECKDALSSLPLLGNRYVLKTSLKCIPVDTAGRTICNADKTPREKTLNKYIDNVSTGANFLTGGADVANGNGLIPSMAGNIEKLAYNIYDVAGSFTQESKPYCLEAKVKCHIVAGKDSLMNYSGASPDGLHFSLEDIKKMRADNFIHGRPNVPTTIINSCIGKGGFKNIEDNTKDNIENNTKDSIENNTKDSIENNTKDSIENNIENNIEDSIEYNIEDIIDYINKNIITQNGDKIIYSSNIDNIIESVNFEDSTIVKIYYLGLSLLMLLIMFKLLYGKHKI